MIQPSDWCGAWTVLQPPAASAHLSTYDALSPPPSLPGDLCTWTLLLARLRQLDAANQPAREGEGCIVTPLEGDERERARTI